MGFGGEVSLLEGVEGEFVGWGEKGGGKGSLWLWLGGGVGGGGVGWGKGGGKGGGKGDGMGWGGVGVLALGGGCVGFGGWVC